MLERRRPGRWQAAVTMRLRSASMPRLRPRYIVANAPAKDPTSRHRSSRQVFGPPVSHWYEVFSGAQITFGAVREPQEVVNDPQLRANDIVVPLEGAGEKLTSTISSPIQVHGVTKVPARRAPGIGEHNDEVLKELGFTAGDIDGFRASGTIPHPSNSESAATRGGR